MSWILVPVAAWAVCLEASPPTRELHVPIHMAMIRMAATLSRVSTVRHAFNPRTC